MTVRAVIDCGRVESGSKRAERGRLVWLCLKMTAPFPPTVVAVPKQPEPPDSVGLMEADIKMWGWISCLSS